MLSLYKDIYYKLNFFRHIIKYRRFYSQIQPTYNVDNLNNDQIIFLLEKISKSRLNDQKIWETLCTKISSSLYELEFDKIKSILHSISRINHFHFAFTSKLLKCILSKDEIDSRSLTQILIDLKAINYLHPNIFNCLVHRHINDFSNVDYFDAIMLLHLSSHVRVRDLSFISKIIEKIENDEIFKKIMLDTGLVSSLIRSLSCLDVAHPILEKLLHSASPLIYKFNPQELSNTAFSIIMHINSRQIPMDDFITSEYFDIFLMLCKQCKVNLHKMVHIEINQLRTIGWYLFSDNPELKPQENPIILEKRDELNKLKGFFNETMKVKLDFKPKSSKLQYTVVKLIQELGLEFIEEYNLGPYLIDIVLPSHRVAIEVNGFSHFYDQTMLLTSKTRLKYAILHKLGWKVAEVNHQSWKNINRTERLTKLQQLLKPLLTR